MSSIKPNKNMVRRDKSRTYDTGYLDYFMVAINDEIGFYPSLQPIISNSTNADYVTAVNWFLKPDIISEVPTPPIPIEFQKVEVVQNSIKLNAKQLGNLMDSSSGDATLTFQLDNNKESLGFLEMYKRADMQIVLPKANGQQLWLGREDGVCRFSDFTAEESIDKSKIDCTIKCSRYNVTYLLNPITVV